MAAFKPIDPKRDEFRRYLEHNGVIEALTKVFVRLLKEPERPADPIAFLRSNLGEARLQSENVAYLQTELDEARSQIENLREIIQRIDPFALSDGDRGAENSGNAQRPDGMNGGENDTHANTEDAKQYTSSVPAGNSTAVVEESSPSEVNQSAENCHVESTTTAANNAAVEAIQENTTQA